MISTAIGAIDIIHSPDCNGKLASFLALQLEVGPTFGEAGQMIIKKGDVPAPDIDLISNCTIKHAAIKS
jgi:hypothetical protein